MNRLNNDIQLLACTIATLGWLYVALASLWPRLFEREIVKHSLPDPSGYRMGWLILWRLPYRVGVLLAIVSSTPIFAIMFLQGWIVVTISAVILGAIVCCWLFAPPGMRFGIVERTVTDSAPLFELKRSAQLPWALILLVFAGLFPALGIGALLSWILQ